jgi:hypothetical protein
MMSKVVRFSTPIAPAQSEPEGRGAVIAFRPKPGPSMPAWKVRLLANWSNPANWEAHGSEGAFRFFAEQLAAIFYRDEDSGYWSFTVFDGPAYGEETGYLWCFSDDAQDAALKHLIKIVEGRDKRAKKAKRKGRATR